MIRIEHARLSSGLSAIAVPGDGIVTITVSRALNPADQRAAARTALRAARRAGWLPGRLPVWLLPWLPLLARKDPFSIPAKVHALVAGLATAGLSAVVATALLSAPPPSGSVRVIPVRPSPSPSASAPVLRHHRRRPVAARRPVTIVAAAPSPQQVQTGQSPKPSASTASPAPSSSPTPASSPVLGVGTCVYLLGIRVCLGV